MTPITYTVDVAPNVTPEDLTYSITDTLPAGHDVRRGLRHRRRDLRRRQGDVERRTCPRPTASEGTYDVTTSTTDTSCVNPFSGEADYLDLLTATSAPEGRRRRSPGTRKLFTAFDTRPSSGSTTRRYQGRRFTDDGFLVYGERLRARHADEPWTPQVGAQPGAPNNLAAVLWQDMAGPLRRSGAGVRQSPLAPDRRSTG